MTRTVRSLLPVFLLLLFAAAVQANIIISPIYDGSITGDAKASSIESTIQAAINAYQNVITNNITVSIYFQEGGGLGQSNTLVYSGPYTDFYNGLTANNSNPGAIAALNANGGNATTNGGINPVTGANSIELRSANARALGINIPPACFVVSGNCQFPGSGSPVDGIISLNTSITNPGGGSYSLLATTEHEIDEVLGLGSALENVNANSGVENAANDTPFAPNTLVSSPEDLYRWSALTGGTRTLSVDCAASASAYFSYGPSTGAIQQFNNTCNGADFGDWAGSGTPNVQDAFATPGATPVLAAAELDALSAIGYSVAVPEPSTCALMFGALLTAGSLKRRLKGWPKRKTSRP